MMSMTLNSVSFQRSSFAGTRVQSEGVAVSFWQLLAPLGPLTGPDGCAAAPRRAPAPTRAVRLVRAGPDRGDDTWGKGQDEQAKTPEQGSAPSGDRAIIGQKAQPTGAKANEEPPSENMGATGSPEKRQANDGYDDDVIATGKRPS